MNPEEMWATWKRTGLPAFKGKPEPEDGVAYFEVLSNGDALVIPRRNSLGTPNTLNICNFNAAIDALKRDAKYGSDNDRTEGRIGGTLSKTEYYSKRGWLKDFGHPLSF